MKITFLGASDIKFPILDDIICDACHLLNWEVITKVLIGKNDPLSEAVNRYFFLIRPVRIVLQKDQRIKRADLIISLEKEVSLQGIRKPVLHYSYRLASYLDKYRTDDTIPF